MHGDIMLGLTLIVALGVSAQWIAWRLRIPSILLLLVFGFLAGNLRHLLGHVPEVLNPDAVLGDMLLPVVSLFVALILYEGGLTLNLREITNVRGVVRNLVTVGILVTWVLATAAAHWIVGLDWRVASVLGALLVVSGPTVIGPMLRLLRPKRQLGSIIRWEGIVNDPIGALLAVLVFEVTLSGDVQSATSIAVFGVLKTLFVAGGLGTAGALLLALMLRRHWIPDYLHNAVSMAFVIVLFTLTDHIQPESGLFTATVMGIVLANQRLARIHHIIEFKEHLRVMLISTLFILLSARLTFDQISQLGWGSLFFVAVLILIVRPAAVVASTLGSGINWRERALLAWLAPRGIVAAAVSSVFALRLEQEYPEAALLGPLTFLVIVATVAVYGLTAGPLARWLGVADPNPQGILLVGAHSWARALAEVLHREGIRVLLIDSNRTNASAARMAGLPTYSGNVLGDFIEDELDLQGIGRLLAVTPNDEVNALAVQRFERLFGQKEVYQMPPAIGRGGKKRLAHDIHGRLLFTDELTYTRMLERVRGGSVFRATPLTESFDYEALRGRFGFDVVPLVIKRANGSLTIIAADQDPKPKPGDTIITLGPPDEKPVAALKPDPTQ
ncbi:MAG: cation:proton antiporter [Phycisphaerae bacterium]|nr:cation:proton antiporter [Phycisphaerae bacterium]